MKHYFAAECEGSVVALCLEPNEDNVDGRMKLAAETSLTLPCPAGCGRSHIFPRITEAEYAQHTDDGEPDRTPYVGEGRDGAERSAQIDREEADSLDEGPRRDAVLTSAARWDAQALRHA